MKLTNEPIPWQDLPGRHWIVDDAHRMFYCLIPKAANHTVRQLLATPILGRLNVSVLYPMQSYLSAAGFRLLYKMDEGERQAVLDDYFMMIAIRHPLDRLQSAYANKMKQAAL
ncbi:hypothetical protein LSH36_669g02031 [Paralvinella palmiformis]|uniref:Carbohydrate sulfotransferase n=1 Tax=Paralvinella palmiformis TaxID=53620 RepID=A0AAD9J2Q3_9ANNE|nr:hypothetical protein LSH36_669g02031 [Paralvinella palmiformis]